VLCDVKKDYDGAIASFREAIRLDPGNADAHVNLGVALGLSGQYDEAVASYREAVRLRPNNHGDRERLLIAQSTVAAIWFNQYRHAKSESLLREAYALHQQWAAESRGRSEYPVVLGGICCNMGNVLADTNRSADALGWYDQAIQGLSAVLEKEQGPVEARSFLLNSYFGRSLALISLKRFAEALRDCDLALKTDDGSQQPSLRLHRARCQSHVDPDAAAKTIEDVLQAEKTSPANLYSGALAYGVAHAKAEDQPRRERYAVRAIELLHKAQAAGYFNDPNAVTNLQTEPDLDSLRNREDFRKFLKSLEGKTKR
jgi:tetratricopeptide (TPR) repeat protein